MAKGYWIGRVDVSSEEGYQALCRRQSRDLPQVWRPLRGARRQIRMRRRRQPLRNVVIEFPDYAAALACYRSPEYQANIKVRQPHAIADLVVVEGYDGPQP